MDSRIPDVSSRALTPSEKARYARHMVLPEVEAEGQMKLKAASVLIVGVGGLGSPAALYLAAAGVGRIGLVDFDVVDESNLQRQVLYDDADVGKPKVQVAAERLRRANSHIQVETHQLHLDSANALDLVKRYDVVVDGSDNFPTRYLVNDACVLTKTPLVFGAIFRFEGQASVFAHADGPCYRCLYATPPGPGVVPDCNEAGVFGVLPGIIGTIQATEALKLLLGIGDSLVGRLLLYDAARMDVTTIQVARNPLCAVCGDAPTVTGLIDYEAFCGLRAPGTASIPQMSGTRLRQQLTSHDAPLVLDVREPAERAVASIEGSLHIPLGQLEARLADLSRDRAIVVYCKAGPRSMRASALLLAAGYTKVSNLAGGMDAWVRDLASDLARPENRERNAA